MIHETLNEHEWKKMNPTYDTIGKTYDVTRRADPQITQILIDHLKPNSNGRYLDIGCGSGNYTGALHAQGISIDGLDISREMLSKANSKYPDISWYEGDACAMPFSDATYDGAISVLATHHIGDIAQAAQEAFRIIKKGRFVVFTATPEQMKHYWLNEYFPKSVQYSWNMMHSVEQLTDAFTLAGFQNINYEPFFVTNALEDFFLQSGKYRPEIYLEAHVRQGMSTFPLSPECEEIEQGLQRLARDISNNHISEVIQRYESSCGDYLFFSGEKEGV